MTKVKQELGGVLSASELEQFRTLGYLIKRGLLADEAERLRETFMELHKQGPVPGHFTPQSAEEAGGDMLKQFPRVMHPHRFMKYAEEMMLHRGVMHVLADLFEEEPIASQSMFYYKPPGARGQALHQDNFYLKVEPGTCIAAWTAVDRVDEENGGLMVVPQTNGLDVLCPEQADPAVSFTTELVRPPEGKQAVPVIMEPGDVLFFNGSMIHGSYPNTSQDRFRRSFICHYVGESTTKIGQAYNPLYRYDGTQIIIEGNPWSGPCGTPFEAEIIH